MDEENIVIWIPVVDGGSCQLILRYIRCIIVAIYIDWKEDKTKYVGNHQQNYEILLEPEILITVNSSKLGHRLIVKLKAFD